MMSVVVHEADVVLADPDPFPNLEPPSDALERRQRLSDELVVDLERTRDRNRGKRIEHVVTPREVEGHLDPPARASPAGNPKVRPRLVRRHVHRAQVGRPRRIRRSRPACVTCANIARTPGSSAHRTARP